MRPAAPAVLAAAALALCGACSTTTPRQAAPAPSAGQAAPATSTTSSTCIGADYSLAPGGACIYPAKVAWPSSAVLAVDPSTLDWTDPDTVASAYITTLGTWDTQVDASTAYATHRAAIFTTTGRTSPDTSDPDTARGQGEFTRAAAGDGYSAVSVDALTTEGGPSPNPRQDDGSWHRIVTHTRTVRTRSPEAVISQRTGTTRLTLTRAPGTGQWLVTQATLIEEHDSSDSAHDTAS